jgi:hypothetical protein
MNPARAARWPYAVAAAVVVFVTWLLAGPVTWAAPSTAPSTVPPVVTEAVDLGEVVPIDSAHRTTVLAGGVSATVFELQLPVGATCPGDSLHDQWRVQSFIIPAGDEPGDIVYGVNGPEGTDQYALYEVSTSPYTDILLRGNEVGGRPGEIAAVPPLSFAVFPPGTLPAGRYRMGLACTYFRATAQYWDVEMDVSNDPDDEPGHMTWRLVDPPAGAALPATRVDDSTNWSLPAAITAAVVVLAGALWWRTRRRPTVRLKESK